MVLRSKHNMFTRFHIVYRFFNNRRGGAEKMQTIGVETNIEILDYAHLHHAITHFKSRN